MQQAVADLFAGNRDALTASASAAAGHDVVLPTRFALVGHSAGGSLVMGAAAEMTENGALADLTGIVLLDSVDMNGTVPHALSTLTGANYRPVMDISSERYVWNMFGTVGDELEDARPGQFNGVMLTGGRHIDGLYGGNPVIQAAEYLIAGVSAPKNVAAVQTAARATTLHRVRRSTSPPPRAWPPRWGCPSPRQSASRRRRGTRCPKSS
jgi:acetyl esterase/lipase